MPQETASKDIARTAGEALNTKQAAKFLGVSASKLETDRGKGDCPRFYKIGARVVYYQVDLETWLASKGRTSTAEYEPKPRRDVPVKPAQPKKRAPIRAEVHGEEPERLSLLEVELRKRFRRPIDVVRALGLPEILAELGARPCRISGNTSLMPFAAKIAFPPGMFRQGRGALHPCDFTPN